MHEHHKNRFELAKLAIRTRICTKCYQRPPGSEQWSAAEVRPCQAACTIFLGLPKLIGATTHGPLDESPDEAMEKHVCPTCHASPSAGDFCTDRLDRSCPLSRYGADVLQILEDLGHVKRGAGGGSVA